MTQILAAVDVLELTMQDAEIATLRLVDDADYEFVGGGTAVNSY